MEYSSLTILDLCRSQNGARNKRNGLQRRGANRQKDKKKKGYKRKDTKLTPHHVSLTAIGWGFRLRVGGWPESDTTIKN